MKNSLREKCIIKLNKLPKGAVIAIGFLTIMLAGVIEVLLNKVSKYAGPVAFVIVAIIGFWIIISPNEYKKLIEEEAAKKKAAAKPAKMQAQTNTTVKKITKRTNKQHKKKKQRR